MDIYTALTEIKAHELKYGEYPETDKNIVLEKINTFCSKFFGAVPQEFFQHGNYFFIDVLPTNTQNLSDMMKDYIGYDFAENDFHTLDKTEFYERISDNDDIKNSFENLFENDYIESCYIGNKFYCMPNTNIFYNLLDVYCIRYKNYTLVISYGNDE